MGARNPVTFGWIMITVYLLVRTQCSLPWTQNPVSSNAPFVPIQRAIRP